MATSRRLVGIGVGPGDPQLVTVRAVEALRRSSVVFVPGRRAEAVVREWVPPQRIRRLPFALSCDDAACRRAHRRAAELVAAALARSRQVAFATMGDPSLYSTFAPLARAVRLLLPGVEVEVVPGITAAQALAARAGIALAEGSERLALVPAPAGRGPLEQALAVADCVVIYKTGQRLPEVLGVLERAGRLEGAIYGAHLGLEDEQVCPASALGGRAAPYLATVIAPPSRTGGA